MKVLYIPDIFENGGAYNSFKEMIGELHLLYNVEPVILTAQDGKYAKFANDNNFECHIIKYKQFYIGTDGSRKDISKKERLRSLYYLRNVILDHHALKTLKNEVDFNCIDLIHTNIDRNDLGGYLSTKFCKPHIWHIREYGEQDYNCVPISRDYIKFMNQHATKFICISKSIEKYWISKGLDPAKTTVIYNGVSKKYLNDKKKIENNAKINIVMSGNISEEKGQIQLIRAIEKLDNRILEKIHIDIYGSGKPDYIQKLKNEIENNHLTNVIEFKGYADNMPEILKNYDIGVMASKCEAFGRSTIEYMMSGLFVIASDSGANPEIIKNNETGILYEHNNYIDLSNKIKYSINNPDIVRNLANRGRKYALSRFTSDINAKNIHSLYVDVLKRNE